jgi:DNA-binding MarR family transcriptional regulator
MSPAEYDHQEAALRARQGALQAFREERAGERGPAVIGALVRPTIFAAKPYRRVRDPDARRVRRRRLYCGGALPPALLARFTAGEGACLAVILKEIRRKGSCRLSLKEIADLAGVTRTIVKRAIRIAIAEGLIEKRERPQTGRKHATNVLTIAAGTDEGRALIAWNREADRRAKARETIGGTKFVPTRQAHASTRKSVDLPPRAAPETPAKWVFLAEGSPEYREHEAAAGRKLPVQRHENGIGGRLFPTRWPAKAAG